MIINKQECEDAANELGLRDKSAGRGQWKLKPHGCISAKKPKDDLIFASPVGHPYNNIPCGATAEHSIWGDKKSYDCICAKEGDIDF